MITHKIYFASLTNVLINGLGFISLYFVAHYMGPNAVGVIAFALAYIGIFQSFSDLGFGAAHIKRVSEGKNLGKCNGTYFTIKSLLTVIMTIIILSTIFISKFIKHKSFVSKEHEIVLYIIIVSTAIGNLSMMLNLTFSGRRETAKQMMPQLAGKIVEAIGKAGVALAGLGIILLAGINLLAAVVVLLCYGYLFRGYPIIKPDREYFKCYASFAVPIMFFTFFAAFGENLDKVLLQFFWSADEVGYYAAAISISSVLTFINAASNALIFPTISAYHAQGNVVGIQNLSIQAERYLVMIFSPAVAFVFIFAHSIIRLVLGPKFSPSVPLLIISSFVVLINGITQPYAQQTAGTNRIMLYAKLSSLIIIFNILLDFFLIPKEFLGVKLLGMGAIGASLGILISNIIGSVLFRFYAYKITAIKPNPRILFHVLAAFIMGISLFFFSANMAIISWYFLILFAFIGAIIYIIVLAICREFTSKDLRLFLSILNPIRTKQYAVTEIRTKYLQDP